MKTKTTYLKNYQPSNFNISNVNLTFDIKGLDSVHVTNEIYLHRQTPGDLFLNGDDLSLVALYINGEALSKEFYSLTEAGLEVKTVLDTFVLRIETELNPQKNTALIGLYASRGMLCTQCEPEGFRRITYYLDRPDILSTFTTKIIAHLDLFPYLLSNGNLIESGRLNDGRGFVIWHDPFPKPSYLFALVAGDLVRVSDKFKTCTGRLVGLDVFVEHGDEHLCEIAIQAMKDAMRWDEERFGREYDLERYMIVAVKDFNMGAMENKGLNIFNAKYVLANEQMATEEDIYDIESVIAHEYFHNWTGNRVTCRDWFQLSLKEGLTIYRDQSFSADMHGVVSQRIGDVIYLRKFQFPEDAGSMKHAVQPKSYEEINNFYTSTIYQKGAEIVRMYEVLLGKEGFRRGMDLYFERHDGQAVRIEEFLQAMSDANHYDLTQFKRWYDEAGTPILEVFEWIEGQELVIEVQQSGTSQPLMIPLRWAAYEENGTRLRHFPELLIVTQTKQTFRFPLEKTNIKINYLQGFSAPVILKRNITAEDQLALLGLEEDGFALWDLKQKIWIDRIQASYEQKKLLKNDEKLLKILKQWIHSSKSSEELVELFKMPSFEECLVGLSSVDVYQLEQTRLAFQQQLADNLEHDFAHVIQTVTHHAWRNLILNYLMLANEEHYLDDCWQQLVEPKNMTQQLGAFRCLNRSRKANEAIDFFYKQWYHNEIVLDKWFVEQAIVPRDNALTWIKKLSEHPKFNWENPNKVRSLIGAFIQNHLSFHAIDGSGYVFLRECIEKVDRLNPQAAARLVVPFTRFGFLDKKRQDLIKEQLNLLIQHDLSSDVYEMVSKSLQ